MHPSAHAAIDPGRAALIMAETGDVLRYDMLDARTNRSAHALRACGLGRGDVVATLFDNGPEVFVFGWASQKAGLYLTSVSNKLSASDIAYVLRDCGAKLLVVSDGYAPLARQALSLTPPIAAFCWTSAVRDLASWTALADIQPATVIPDQSPGTDMLYSSGTTGRPKGVKFPLPDGAIDHPTPLTAMGTQLYGMGADTIYLSSSPLYHAAPLRWAMTVQRLGGTVIIMERFDAEEALALIARHHVTHATFVPTHFVRLLKLSAEVRAKYDISSLRAVIHAAAPCPIPVKRAMIDWWGPIIHEYYSGTESCGITALSTGEWLAKPGSVGKAVLGSLRITDDDGNEVAPGTDGNVCFADGPGFEYHNDPAKTALAHDRNGWATLGDVGHVDADGYLFLTDRKSFMIISGGVNIYPQEIENYLIAHPKIVDVAVIGVPDDEMGEKVVAIVQLVDGVEASSMLADELRGFVHAGLGGVKTPRAFEFCLALPRESTGKLLKRKLIDEFSAIARIKGGATEPL